MILIEFSNLISLIFHFTVDNESHYNSKHRHSCGTCKKSLPSAHLLDLHIQENHDSYFKLLSVKKPSYECFLEMCHSKFWSPEERRGHSIQSHAFPEDFKFDSQPSTKNTRNKKAGSASPEAVKKRTKKNSRPRPKSVYASTATPMDTSESKIVSNHHATENSSKLPVVSTIPRRLSLSPVKPNRSIDPGPVSAPVTTR